MAPTLLNASISLLVFVRLYWNLVNDSSVIRRPENTSSFLSMAWQDGCRTLPHARGSNASQKLMDVLSVIHLPEAHLLNQHGMAW